ncbi:hypothetical protein B0T16DRAFT_457164 [Cercophora newfieldiana]|uniref:Uncharacterized protein n=1 Tax=Cercophora newfieldiana TaxID=92897 RepID=A0AA39YBW2_9PEZI|nr:hypothetical protein B0T16DRAFT_457164 [Cercophora newfieldiana]
MDPTIVNLAAPVLPVLSAVPSLASLALRRLPIRYQNDEPMRSDIITELVLAMLKHNNGSPIDWDRWLSPFFSLMTATAAHRFARSLSKLLQNSAHAAPFQAWIGPALEQNLMAALLSPDTPRDPHALYASDIRVVTAVLRRRIAQGDPEWVSDVFFPSFLSGWASPGLLTLLQLIRRSHPALFPACVAHMLPRDVARLALKPTDLTAEAADDDPDFRHDAPRFLTRSTAPFSPGRRFVELVAVLEGDFRQAVLVEMARRNFVSPAWRKVRLDLRAREELFWAWKGESGGLLAEIGAREVVWEEVLVWEEGEEEVEGSGERGW